ncbi:diguanylate cyclase [Rhizobiaceae bacterium BDR2-2]|uniref:Diguanylate cyclase n=1 Tax=Ectorhizobium quercum TaxID=2965071 RepID=A0AAE3SU73_9HYPH|nr:diguanylate cyclase [Ectorhizobium quercum]MCX8995739.1 diguanylate cyclase [Ectorhizobium quercum]
MTFRHIYSPGAASHRPEARLAFRNAFVRGLIVSVPVLVLHALLLALAGEPGWALLSVAVILVIAIACMVAIHAPDHHPLAATAVPAVVFASAYCLVLAIGFGPAFGFHNLLIVFLPLMLLWEKVGEAGKWGGATALALVVLWVELGGAGTFLAKGDAAGLPANLFRFVNVAASLLLLVAFVRILFDFKDDQRRREPSPAVSSRSGTGGSERRRLTDAVNRPHLHFLDPDRVFSVIFVGIDHHVAIAEIFGPRAADDVTRHVSALIMGKVRETDMISRRCRGGFLIFLPETVEEEAHTVGERIRMAIAATLLPAAGLTIRVSATLGIAQSASNADVAAVIEEAQNAAAAGRAAGHNRTMLAGLL